MRDRLLGLVHRVFPELATPPHVNALQSNLTAALVEVQKLQREVYVPGLWRCPKCEFHLVQSNLNANDGTVTARDTPGDKCPNCHGPLWRVTYREQAAELLKLAEKQSDDLKAAKADAARNANLADAAILLAERVPDLHETERRQLGLPAMAAADQNAKQPGERTLSLVEAALENDRATVAKFRLLKQRVRTIIVEVDQLLDRLDTIGKKNVVTPSEVSRLRELRDLLRNVRGTGGATLERAEDGDGR